MELLQQIFSRLQALNMFYKTAHWQCKNVVFYGDHLLLDRLSDDSYKFVDPLAEKMIGKTGDTHVVDLPVILKRVYEHIKGLPMSADENSRYFEAALNLEQELLNICEQYDQSPDASVGCRNLIGDIADLTEGRIYLLKQRIAKKVAPINPLQVK